MRARTGPSYGVRNSHPVQYVNGTRVSRDGDPLDVPPIAVNPNIGVVTVAPQVAWDGSNWFVVSKH